jgi:hypothetical protein
MCPRLPSPRLVRHRDGLAALASAESMQPLPPHLNDRGYWYDAFAEPVRRILASR